MGEVGREACERCGEDTASFGVRVETSPQLRGAVEMPETYTLTLD